MKKIFYQICAAFIRDKEKRRKFRRKYVHIKKTDPVTVNLIIKDGMQNKDEHVVLNDNIHFFGYNLVAPGVGIGRFSYVGRYTILDLNVTIGRYCSIATNVLIGTTIHPQNWLSSSPFQYDNWLDPETPKQKWKICKKTIIGNDVWIGAGVVIQSGVRVGDGAIIGSGAVVTHDVPPYSIVVGVPAKILRYRFPMKIIRKLMDLQWWNLPHDEIRKLNFSDINTAIKQIEGLK